MKSYKVTNLTQSLMSLGSGLTVQPEATSVLSHAEYSKCQGAVSSFVATGWLKVEEVAQASDAETNSDAANFADAEKELKAKLADLKAEFKKKETSAARKEQIALEVEQLKLDSKKLK